MRIGFVLYGDLSIRTGGFLYDRMLIHGLETLGLEFELLELPWRTYPSALLQAPSELLLEWTQKHDFDLLIQDELAHPSLLRANRILRERLQVPVVTIVHHLRCSEDYAPALNWIHRKVEGTYLAEVDGMIVNSEATMASVRLLDDRQIPSLIAQPGRGHFNPQLTEPKLFERSMDRSSFEVLYLGSVIPRKGLHDLIAALSDCGLSNLTLTVIGREGHSTRYTRQIKTMLEKTGLVSQTNWLGESTDRQVRRALTRAHVLAVPSTHEGFGIAYLDAMGFGVVPIGTTSGGARSIIQSGENGFLIDPGDRKSLGERIQELAHNRELLARMSVQALQRYREQPTWEDISANVYEFLTANFLMDPVHAMVA